MSQWNELLDKAKDLANAATKKTGEVVETSKLKLQEASLNTDIENAYEKIGSYVYRTHKTGVDYEERIQKEIDKVDGLLEALGELEEKMAEIKKVRKCANCGAICPLESHFCSRCGMIIDKQSYNPAYDVEYTEVNQEADAPQEPETESTEPTQSTESTEWAQPAQDEDTTKNPMD